MSRRLSEKKVQDRALAYLHRHYRFRARRGRVFVQAEVRTRPRYGGKRADGLLAYRSWWGPTRVVSLEAKSLKTLRALRPRRQDHWLLMRSLWMGLLVCLGSGAFFFLYKMDDPYLRYALPLNVLIGTALLYALLTRRSSRHQQAQVIDQLQQYPANRQWLACSADSLRDLTERERQQLKAICRRRGIGVLVVPQRGRVRRWLRPGFHRKWIGDFLEYYSRENEIRRILA